MPHNARLYGLLIALVALPLWAADDHTVQTDVMIPMRDGVALSADVYLPKGEGPFPIVLARSVYGRGNLGFAQPFLDLGAGFVVQDTRGRGGSGDVDRVFEDDGWGERQDGADTVAWVLAQPWCNGKLGTWGGSALGITQERLARATGGVTCQSIWVASSNFYGELSYMGGVWRKKMCETWLTGQGNAHVIDLWKTHPARDGYWKQFDNVDRVAEVTAPALHVGSWWDLWPQGTIANFVMRQNQGGEGARGNQLLLMGPWSHGLTSTPRDFGDLKLPENYNFDVNGLQARFYRHWLLGEDNGIMEEPPIRYYTLGDADDPESPGNEWRTAETWPPFATKETPFYLARHGALTSEPADAGRRVFIFDPKDPVPTHGGGNLVIPSGPFDQRKVSGRDDVLCFATAPLETPVENTGAVRVELFVSSDAPDTDFTAKLVDIYPDGRELLLTDSIQRVKFREGYTSPSPLAAGTVGKLTIDLAVTSVIFNTGHRIGVQISSSNYPRFEVNPNNGDDFPTDENMRPALNTVHFGGAHPSVLYLSTPVE